MTNDELALQIHKKHHGKISLSLRDIPTKETLKLYYTPGVAAVSKHLASRPEELRDYTWVNNLVAVISDGSSVLGLGDIGPRASMPVMEGKAMLFKHFADIDAVPIVLDVHTADEIVSAVKAIAPSFGGINLEDIAAPVCFEVEERLKAELDIPVMHDDQHGTAIVVLAGLINALRVRGNSNIAQCRIVIVGAGAAGTAIAKLLQFYGARDIVIVDSKGIIGPKRSHLNPEKQKLVSFNTLGREGGLGEAMEDADIFIGVSRGGLLTPQLIKKMAKAPIIFALANPDPEIMPDEAKRAGALVVATGRSDFPNQVNNALAFPGVFRGALDNRVTRITDEHKVAAAQAIASLVKTPTSNKIIPSVFDTNLTTVISRVIV